jgi:hypothetical protein
VKELPPAPPPPPVTVHLIHVAHAVMCPSLTRRPSVQTRRVRVCAVRTHSATQGGGCIHTYTHTGGAGGLRRGPGDAGQCRALLHADAVLPRTIPAMYTPAIYIPVSRPAPPRPAPPPTRPSHALPISHSLYPSVRVSILVTIHLTGHGWPVAASTRTAPVFQRTHVSCLKA